MNAEGWHVAVVLLSLFALVQSVAIFALARSVGVLQLALDGPSGHRAHAGLPIGAVAPALRGVDATTGGTVALETGGGRRLLAVFVSPTCGSCRDAVVYARTLSETAYGTATPIVVVRGSLEESQAITALAGHLMVLSDPAGSVHEAYRIDLVPFAYLIADGHVAGSGFVPRQDQMQTLLRPETSDRTSDGRSDSVQAAREATT